MNLNLSVKAGRWAAAGLVCLIVGVAFHVWGNWPKTSVVSQPAVARPVPPWTERAEEAARLFIEANAQQLANSIQRIAHPEGKRPELLAHREISTLDNRILVKVAVSWSGSSTRRSYITWVAWELSEKSLVQAKVVSDSALTRVTAKNGARLDEHFREKIYPAVSHGSGTTTP